mmetsp:Transcript_13845/g.32846  ORF Transcript_13845/g.32846 Transcript_13845/m.32846 type:complete len:389 (+) Transcript_13845:423-1589(+)
MKWTQGSPAAFASMSRTRLRPVAKSPTPKRCPGGTPGFRGHTAVKFDGPSAPGVPGPFPPFPPFRPLLSARAKTTASLRGSHLKKKKDGWKNGGGLLFTTWKAGTAAKPESPRAKGHSPGEHHCLLSSQFVKPNCRCVNVGGYGECACVGGNVAVVASVGTLWATGVLGGGGVGGVVAVPGPAGRLAQPLPELLPRLVVAPLGGLVHGEELAAHALLRGGRSRGVVMGGGHERVSFGEEASVFPGLAVNKFLEADHVHQAFPLHLPDPLGEEVEGAHQRVLVLPQGIPRRLLEQVDGRPGRENQRAAGGAAEHHEGLERHPHIVPAAVVGLESGVLPALGAELCVRDLDQSVACAGSPVAEALIFGALGGGGNALSQEDVDPSAPHGS